MKPAYGNESFRNEKRMRSGDIHAKGSKHPSRCPYCGLVSLDGTWRRPAGSSKANLKECLCPACLQLRDGKTGGLVRLGGAFAILHREDILNRVRNVEKRTAQGRPLERIMRIEERGEIIAIATTSEHLAARIAKAVQSDFGGTLNLKYAPGEKYVSAEWLRDA